MELSFRLPDEARLATPVKVRVALALHDLDGQVPARTGRRPPPRGDYIVVDAEATSDGAE